MKLRTFKIPMLLLLILALATSCSGVFERLDFPESPSPSVIDSDVPSATEEPTPSPIPRTPEPVPVPLTFTLVAAGDVMAHNDNLKAAYDPDTGLYDFSENYMHVFPFISSADFSIVNLETVTAGPESSYTSYPLFNTPSSIVSALAGSGFTALVTANNHSLDRGRDGVIKTIGTIDENNLLHTGSYLTPGKNYLTYEYNGYEISVLAYTQHLNGNEPLLADDEKYMINVMDLEGIIDDISTASSHSDLIVIYLHWGNEYTRSEEEWQADYARALFEAGADVILGTHPHVVRPAEIMNVNGEDKYVIYSMGNFISNFIRTDNRENAIYTEDGVIVRLSFDIDPDEGFSLANAEHIPTWPYKYETDGDLHYEIIPVIDPDARLHENDYADSEARKSYYRTMETLGSFTPVQ